MKDNSASLIWCSDAFVLDYDGKRACDKAVKGKSTEIPTGPFIRDHVKIDLKGELLNIQENLMRKLYHQESALLLL